MNTLSSQLKGGTPSRAQRRRRSAFTPARLGVYAFLLTAALFFLLPLYVML
ncbi:MAG TPA: carbohydrate ABC transporter permease, partial [Paraburkholderia sp.]|nr:carbohydrate ABC transporter permease [Paraburkholderia sp.]